MRRYASRGSYAQGDYSNTPDDPTGQIRNKGLLNQAVDQAKLSGNVKEIYSQLPETVRVEFSLKTFERLVGKK